MRSTFKVLFYLKCNAPKKDGLIPVMCRITINGKIAQFSCKLDVEEKSWNVELGRVSGRSIAAQETNRMLDKIRVGINQAYQTIAGLGKADHGRGGACTLRVCDNNGLAALHDSHAAVGGAKVDSDDFRHDTYTS